MWQKIVAENIFSSTKVKEMMTVMNLNGTFPFTLTWVRIRSSPSHICPRCCSRVLLVCVLTKLVSLGWIWREGIWVVHRKKDASPSLRHKELLSNVESETLRSTLLHILIFSLSLDLHLSSYFFVPTSLLNLLYFRASDNSSSHPGL